MTDLDLLTVGMVLDMYTESGNDSRELDENGECIRQATQKDINRFF